MHKNAMDDAVMRVRISRVLPGCDDMDPPFQPQGADKHKTLAEFHGWPLTWPKTQVRLMGHLSATSIVRPPPRIPPVTGATSIVWPPPRKPPVIVATTSRHQQLLGVCGPSQG